MSTVVISRVATIEEVKREAVRLAIREAKWNVSIAARLLGLSRPTVRRYLDQYSITRETL